MGKRKLDSNDEENITALIALREGLRKELKNLPLRRREIIHEMKTLSNKKIAKKFEVTESTISKLSPRYNNILR